LPIPEATEDGFHRRDTDLLSARIYAEVLLPQRRLGEKVAEGQMRGLEEKAEGRMQKAEGRRQN
jgi:hypothetical protein